MGTFEDAVDAASGTIETLAFYANELVLGFVIALLILAWILMGRGTGDEPLPRG